MHEMQTIATDDPVAWVSVSQSVCRVGDCYLVIHQMAPCTSMRPLLRYCSHLFDLGHRGLNFR